MTFPYQPYQAVPGVPSLPSQEQIPFDKGYDATSHANAPTAEDGGASGFLLRPSGAQIDLWITEVAADFSLSGEQGQSRMLREFFPHSFNDVTLKVTGNVASTQEYNRLAMFVREHHWSALQNINSGSSADQTITFVLYNTYSGGRTWPTSSTTKGPHRPWSVTGYIKSVAAGAVRWEVAPAFTLEFIVTTSVLSGNTGIWSDTPDNGGSTLQTFMQLVAAANGGELVSPGAGFTSDPVIAQLPESSTAVGIAGYDQYLTWSGQAAGATLTRIR